MPHSSTPRSAGPAVALLPDDVLLKVFEQLDGVELHSAACVNTEWRALLTKHTFVWKNALEAEFAAAACCSCHAAKQEWKKAYVHAFVQARVDRLNRCQLEYAQLQAQLGDLEGLLLQARSVRGQLCGSFLDGPLPDPISLMVDAMEKDVLVRQLEAQSDLLCAQVQLEALQAEVSHLQAHAPCHAWA